MKKMNVILTLFVLVCSTMASQAKIFGLQIGVSVSSKAYWDGKGCTPREKGGCVHIEIGENALQLGNSNGQLYLEASTDVLKNPSYSKLFTNGNFYVGEITIDQSILDQLKYSGRNTFSDKVYPYKIEKGMIVIFLN